MSNRRSILALLAIISCSTGPADVVDLRTLELSTTIALEADTLDALEGAVRVHNASAWPAIVMLRSPCTVVMRAYRLDTIDDAPAWDQSRHPGGCKSFPFEFVVGGSGSRSLEFGPIQSVEILGDSLPVVRYRVTVFIAQTGEFAPSGVELTVTTAVLKRS
jgi:hypothetical protein